MINNAKEQYVANKSSKASTTKKIAPATITLLLFLGALECLSSAFLFRYYSAVATPFFPSGLAFPYLVKKALEIPIFNPITSVTPHPLYIADRRLGYTTRRGQYRGGFTVRGRTYHFNLTVPQQGIRATSYESRIGGRSIYVFGDSYIFGWGNDDEQTMPWLLQQRFPNFNVINLAQNGYGNTQSVIQYQMIEKNLRDDDIIILVYADFYLVRNFGTPSWISQFSQGINRRPTGPGGLLTGPEGLKDVRYPVARLGPNGKLLIKYIKLNCAENDGYCNQNEPDKSQMLDVTKPVLKFFTNVKPKVILAFIDGANNDPVIKYAHEIGLPVADIRLDKQRVEWNDFYPYDGHPAQIAQYNYFRKLTAALISQNIISKVDTHIAHNGW